MVHPFHPFSGREFRLVAFRQNWGEERVYFYHDDQRLISVPLSWTSLAAVNPFVELAGGRSAFRLSELLELADLLVRLQEVQS
ncbi:DUF5372 family protein [Planctomicrobium sp. SH661]|uniref:DUF5372 family protein n=1 Tax=Planctomicrobium sp. SH661 TaxID=3448124 RepID=UPI003F5BB0E4